MIKFFRKIRQNLLMENKTGKYLKYAFGEIVLVMVGILLALQVNNWNELRKQKSVEFNILKQFEKDIISNISDLKLNASFQEKTINSAQLVLDHMATDTPYNDSLSPHIANAYLWTKFTVNSGAYENLKSRGLEIISNTELRDLILTLYEKNLLWNASYEQIIIDAVETMRNQYNHNFFSKLIVVNYDNGKLTDGKAEVIDYNALRKDNHFRYYLESFIGDTKFLLETITKKYITKHEDVLSLLKTEINLLNND